MDLLRWILRFSVRASAALLTQLNPKSISPLNIARMNQGGISAVVVMRICQKTKTLKLQDPNVNNLYQRLENFPR
jgi:hypothetical protein